MFHNWSVPESHCSVTLWTPLVNRAIVKLNRGGLGDGQRSFKTKAHIEGWLGPTLKKGKGVGGTRLISGI